jgi:hypothetical protein
MLPFSKKLSWNSANVVGSSRSTPKLSRKLSISHLTMLRASQRMSATTSLVLW